MRAITKILEKDFDECADLPRGIRTGWPKDVEPGLGHGKAGHDRHESTRGEIVLGDEIGQIGDRDTRCGRRRKRRCVVRLKAATRIDGRRVVSVDKKCQDSVPCVAAS